MDLNKRKIKILEAIITDYIKTGEPIGSRTIAKKYDLGISSATIRNEMSDLEELGLIMQPHTSSGRVPSDKGYRLYVDKFMNNIKLSEEEISFLKNIIYENINHIDYLMEQTAKALSILTNYTTIVSKPKVKDFSIKNIQLMPLDESSIIATLVTNNKEIKNIIINTTNNFSQQKLLDISANICNIFKTNSLDYIKQSIIPSEQNDFIKTILKEIFNLFNNEEQIKFYTSGVNNILDYPEFSNIEKAKSIFQTFEEKDIFINIFNTNNYEHTNPIQIVIGNENAIEPLKDCSIVKTNYKIANASGTIGIIAPTRMDYAKTVSILNEIIKHIDTVLKGLPPD